MKHCTELSSADLIRAVRHARQPVPPPPLAVRVLGMVGAVLGSGVIIGLSVALLWAITALGFCI